jgi:hypothetical protein
MPTNEDIIRAYVAGNTDDLNVAAREFNDGEYGQPINKTTYGTTNTKAPNELEQYASGMFKFTLAVLSGTQMAYPENTYRAGQTVKTILQSGGGLGATKAITAYEGAGRIEYYIDDIDIEAIIAPTGAQRATNATNIAFKIVEPYSMGLFLQTLQIAAAEEYRNYLETPLLLTLEFLGQDDDGNFIGSSSKRYFPLKLVNMDMNVSGGGTVYDVQAVPYNEVALVNSIQTMQNDIELTGSTIEEILESGSQSLSKTINDKFIEQIDVGQGTRPSEFVIIFPEDVNGTSGVAGASSTDRTSVQGALYDLTQTGNNTQVPKFNIGDLGIGVTNAQNTQAVTRSSQEYIAKQSNISSRLKEALGSTVNEIGKATLANSIDVPGNHPLNKAGLTYNENTLLFENDKMSVSHDLRTYTFPKGSKIQDIIEELVIISDYGKKFADPKPDRNGMVDWFKVETEVYPIADAEEQRRTGSNPKVYVYKVVPYKVHMATISSPTVTAPGFDRLFELANKQYDYIYTGANNDILDFEISLNNQFFSALSADGDSLSATSVTSTRSGTSVNGEVPAIPNQGGSAGNNGGRSGPIGRHDTGRFGGGGNESVATRVARTFHDSIVNSKVDLVTINFQIMGDPYYLADSGMGNYNSRPGTLNVTEDGQMDYQRSEVDIIINFRTPIDYNDDTGLMDFPEDTIPVEPFSGLYKVIQVQSKFSGGKFTQELECIRRINQEGTSSGPSAAKTFNGDRSVLDDAGQASGTPAAANAQNNPTIKEQVERVRTQRTENANNRLQDIRRGVLRGF